VTEPDPSGDLEMDEHLERLRAEAEEERLFQYLKRHGVVPESKVKDKSLNDFQN